MSSMNYVNCVYTTQGDYVCQKNKNLDAFYHKTIVDDGYYNQNNTVMEGFADAVEDGASKFNKIYESNIKNLQNNCIADTKTQIKASACKETLTNMYGSRCKNITFSCNKTNNRQARVDKQTQGTANKPQSTCVNNAYDTNIDTAFNNISTTKSVNKDFLMKTLVC